MKWLSIKTHGFPPMNKNVLITSGDGTIVDVAQWYKQGGKIRWQHGGTCHDFIPEHRNAEYWMNLPKLSNTDKP